jgi:hypothetical protein
MFNVFIFFVKNPGIGNDDDANKEYKFFFDRICINKLKENDSKYVSDKSLENYYFAFIQNDLFNEKNMKLIEHINELCLKVREFMVKKEPGNINHNFIVAVHPPRKEGHATVTEDHIEWQKEMNQLAHHHEKEDINVCIVYYSSKDKENPFLKKDDKYNYDYVKLFDDDENHKVIEKEFEKFLNLLKARANGEEIEFFNLKKKLDNLFHIFFEKALVCKGLLECLKNKRFNEAKNYYIQYFGEKNFETILTDLKNDKEVKGIEIFKKKNEEIYKALVRKLGELSPDSYKGLSNENLEHNENKLIAFLDWYVDFLKILVNSLKEVEKSEH